MLENMKTNRKKVIFWGPYSGHVGTIKAQINSAKSFSLYGEYDAVLIRVHSEFIGMEDELFNNGVRLIDIGLRKYFPGLEKSKFLARRPYMLVVALFGFFPLIRILKREKPDIVIFNLITVPALIACVIANIPAIRIVSIQGYPHFLGIKGNKVPLWKRIEDGVRKFLWNKIYLKADYILAMTQRTQKLIAKNTAINIDKVKVVENPVVDKDVLSGMESQSPHEWFHSGIPVIVAVGRLTKQKGFNILIDAFNALINLGVESRLIILGEGEDRLSLENQILKNNIKEYVLLLGHVADPYPYIAHANLFVLSSLWEDPGHAIIEAAALNTPIVTADCPTWPS